MGCFISKNITVNYTYDELMKRMTSIGLLKDINLIIAIDCTKSNEKTGKKCFDGKCLHDITFTGNPYLNLLDMMQYLVKTDIDLNIPMYFYGSLQSYQTHNNILHVGNGKSVEDLKKLYKDNIVKQTLASPTTFADIIQESINICKSTGRYHVLIILTDGVIEKDYVMENIKVINNASDHPLSIVTVGVGDGPFKKLEELDDKVPKGRRFDNFQFTNMQKVIDSYEIKHEVEHELFRQMFMELPKQYEKILKDGYMSPIEE